MHSLFVLLLAWTPCDAGVTRTGEFLREIYLHPSSQKEITQRFVEENLVPFRDCGEATRGGSCAPYSGNLIEAFLPWADHSVLGPAIKAQEAAYESCWKTLLPNGVDFTNQRSRDIDGSLNAGRVGGFLSMIAADSPDWSIAYDRVPDEELVVRLTRERDEGVLQAARRLSEIAREQPTRLLRLSAGLDAAVEADAAHRRADSAAHSTNYTVHKITLRTITRDVDPRKWKPDEIALLAVKAKEARRLEEERIRTGTPRRRHDRGMTRYYEHYRHILVRAIGVKEAFATLGEPIPWEDSKRRWPDPRGVLGGLFGDGEGGISHFPYERHLYTVEWEEAHPEMRVTFEGDLPQDEVQRRIIEKTRFIEKRWLDVESRAPHMSADEFRKALKKLEAQP